MKPRLSNAMCLATLPALLCVLAGCAAVQNSITTATPEAATDGVGISGTVHGGSQPIANAQIHLYTVGATAYGSSGQDLLNGNKLTTDSNGRFTLPSYTCPSAQTEMYIVATGGNPIAGQAANAQIALMAAFGPCNSYAANKSATVTINEASTVAAVYALAPFLTGPANNLGSSAGNVTGLTNSFTKVNELVTLATGTSPGAALPASATLSVSTLYSLADIMAYCVNSTGGGVTVVNGNSVSDGSACGNLFVLAPSAAGVYPTDTLTAMLNIAKQPQNNAGPLWRLIGSTGPFQPSLTAAPAAWMLTITHASPSFNAPTGIAADNQGNLWIANRGGGTMTLLAPGGTVTGTYGAGTLGDGAVAIDLSGNAWAPVSGSAALAVIPAGGGTVATHTGAGLGNATTSIAVDSSGDIWATGSQNGVSVFTSAGAPVSSSAYTGVGAANPQSIAVTFH